MALLRLLQLLLLASTASAWSWHDYYRYYGGSATFTPKGRNSDGSYEVEIRHKYATHHCYSYYYYYGYTGCYSGNCGYQHQSSIGYIPSHYHGMYACQQEMVTRRKIYSNTPFTVGFYHYHYYYYYGIGYWVRNVRSSWNIWRMTAHLDPGTRSDTGESNRSPITTMVPILRVPMNCPRSFNLTVFDPDGDRVRCRAAIHTYPYECGMCGLINGFSLDQNSCSLTYTYSGRTGYHPVELMVEDFPNNYITLSYSDGSYTSKGPLSGARRKRQISFQGTTTTQQLNTSYPTSTTTGPATTTRVTTITTVGPAIATAAHTTSTAAPTTSTAALTTSTAAPTTSTAAPTTSTAAPTTSTAAPTTSTAAPTTSTAAPTTTTSRTTTTIPPTTTTHVTTTTTTGPTTAPYRNTIAPLSKIPLQFSVHVDGHYAPSCVDGDYFPIFMSPTPANGVNLPAFVNQTLEIRVRSKAKYTTVLNLVMSGPKGISKQRISSEEYLIKWTPSENERNDHFPICFISEARDRYYRIYQSELRCVIADVGRHDATVTCSETTMKVEVEKSYLIRRNEHNLHLNDFRDPSCNLWRLSNSTHLVAVMSLNTCGTLIEEDDENIIFKNDITSADPNEIVSRRHDVDIAFSCVYPKRTNLTLGFRHKNPYAFTERGFGAFTFQFEFFESQLYQRQVDASTYPVEVYLKQMMFMQIEATTSIPNTELFVESCKATPYDNPQSRISYTIIDNGCVKDKTVKIYPSSRLQFRFGMEAFEFIGAHEEVYITCSVILCEAGVRGTRCSQGCLRSSSGRSRVRREAVAETSRHSVSQGPLHLAKTDNQASGLSLNMGMNLVFIVGCLLVCGVVIYHSRRSKAKYQLLPTSDTD